MAEQKNEKQSLIGPIAGTAAAMAAFAVLRKPNFSKDPVLRKMQERSGGKIHVIKDNWRGDESNFHTAHPLNLPDRAWKWVKRNVLNPDIEIHHSDEFVRNQKLKGTVVDIHSGSHVYGDVTINAGPDQRRISKLIDSDIKASRVKEMAQYTPKSRSLADVLTRHGVNINNFKTMGDDETRAVLQRITRKRDYFLKPQYGERSEGLYNLLSKVEEPSMGKKLLKKYPKAPLAELRKNPEKFLAQDPIDIAQEIRFHTIGNKIIDTPQIRHTSTKGVQGFSTPFPKGFNSKHFEESLGKMYAKAKVKHPALVGWDAAIDRSGKLHIIEGNTNSGFAWGSFPTPQKAPVYTALTGKRSTLSSLGFAVPVGVATSYATNKVMEKKSEDNTVSNALLLTATGISGGYLANKYLDKIVAKGINATTNVREARNKELFKTDKLSEKYLTKWKELIKNAEKKDKNTLEANPVGTGIVVGTGAGLTYAAIKPNSAIRDAADRAMGVHPYSGRVPVHAGSAKTILKSVGKKDIFTRDSAKVNDTVGAYLRKSTKRPVFGDDSELTMFGVKNKTPYVYNIADPNSGKAYVKGKHFSIVGDSSAGGLEFNVKPGNADELHRRTHRALTKGAPKINALKNKSHVVINNTLTELTGFDWGEPVSDRRLAVGASSHIHFQAPADKMKGTLHRVMGATAPLNYIVPTAEQRAKGYKGHGTFDPTFEYAKKIPTAYIWENEAERGQLAKQHKVRTTYREKGTPWQPNKGNLAAEVRYSAPMHGDPALSKKFHQLIELSLSDNEHAAKFEQLGKFIHRATGGKHQRLYEPDIKAQVLKRFESIMSHPDLAGDTHIGDITKAIRKNIKMPTNNVLKLWSAVK